MTMWGVFTSADGVTQQTPIAMFRRAEQGTEWAKAVLGERAQFKLKEIEITRCDVVERTGLVTR